MILVLVFSSRIEKIKWFGKETKKMLCLNVKRDFKFKIILLDDREIKFTYKVIKLAFNLFQGFQKQK